MDQLALSEPLAVGSAVVTGAGELPVDLLVHAVVSSATERVSREGVRRALRSALQRVLAWQIAEVAIPPFGLGAGNLDIDESAHLMADELARHLGTAAFPTRVTLVAETPTRRSRWSPPSRGASRERGRQPARPTGAPA